MKKLLIASIVMLASLTACNNSNDEMISTPVGKEKVQSKATARGSDDVANDNDLLQSVNDYMIANKLAGGSAYIACHSDYTQDVGHACVYSGGYLFNVSWTIYESYPHNGNLGNILPEPVYTATQVTTCNCR